MSFRHSTHFIYRASLTLLNYEVESQGQSSTVRQTNLILYGSRAQGYGVNIPSRALFPDGSFCRSLNDSRRSALCAFGLLAQSSKYV